MLAAQPRLCAVPGGEGNGIRERESKARRNCGGSREESVMEERRQVGVGKQEDRTTHDQGFIIIRGPRAFPAAFVLLRHSTS